MNIEGTNFYFPDSTLNNTYLPVFFKTGTAPDQQKFFDFFNALSRPVTVYDQIDMQLQELMVIKSPSIKNDKQAIDEAVKIHLSGIKKEEYGIWVYYPWSGNLVHTVDEAEFIELRTNRNLYKITTEERNTLQQKTIGIIGMSVGQSIAVAIAMERGCGKLRLADFDNLELSNLNRVKSGIENLGLPKVIIAAREIARLDPFINIKCYTEGITEDNIEDFLLTDGKLDLLVEECDSMDVKILSRQRAKQHQIPVIMDTNDRGMLDVERFDLEPDRPLFHGLINEKEAMDLKKFTPEERLSFVMKIVDGENLSDKMKTSMKEIGKSINSWPQLASSVMLGAAVGADTSRRILLNQFYRSGRFYVDLEKIIQ